MGLYWAFDHPSMRLPCARAPWCPRPGPITAAQPHTGHVRITIWVRPGAVHPGIGGEQGGALIVRVSARAVDGKATEAALTSVARAFGVPRRAVTLITGASSRTKVIDVAAGDPAVLAQLLTKPARSGA
jgi:uncharacterized protein YggU (UPF0235/DUF167 family)